MSKYLSENCNELLLSKRFSFSEGDKPLFENMYRDYDQELSLYSERISNNPITTEDFEDVYKNFFLAKMFILNDLGEKIGFCLLGFGDNTHPQTNYYIAEFYISPQYRRSGYGTKAARELFSLLPGKYCYHVLKKNNKAKDFWDRVKNESSYKTLFLRDTSNLTDCDFYAFQTQS